MGMFDYLKCSYPLPVPGANMLEYHSKHTPAQSGDQYLIRADGTLWHQDYDTEDRSDPTATGLARLCGLDTRINERWRPAEMTGEIVFYAGEFEFSGYFVGGKLKHLEVLRAPDSEPTQVQADTIASLKAAIVGLLRYHQEGDDGAELPREYWSPGYREAVEIAESLVSPNNMES